MNAAPDDYDLRLQLARGVRGEQRPDQRAQAVRRGHHHRRQPSGGPRQRGAAALPRVEVQVPTKDAQAQLVAQALAGFDQAIAVGPDYADAYYFRVGAVRGDGRSRPFAGRSAALPREGADRRVGRRRRATCSRRSRRRSNRLRLPCLRPPAGRRSIRRGATAMAQPPAYEIDDSKDLPGDHHHRPRHDRRRPRPQARAEDGQPLRRARPTGLLRRPHLPPCRAGLRDPGRRSRGQRPRWSRLPVGRRAGAGASTRSARWRWRTPDPNTNGSQFFVMHRRLHPQAHQGLQPLRLRGRRHRRRAGHPGRRRDADRRHRGTRRVA